MSSSSIKSSTKTSSKRMVSSKSEPMMETKDKDDCSVGSASIYSVSSKNSKGSTQKGKKTRSRDKPMTAAQIEAAHHVKEFMTDIQKALTYLKIGKQLETREDYFGAIELFNEGIDLNPTPGLFTARAHSHKCLSKWREAYFDYSLAIKLDPENGNLYCSRGLCLSKIHRIEFALEDLDQAIHCEPSSFHYYTKGTLLADNGQLRDAIECFNATLNIEIIQQDIKMRAFYRKALCHFELDEYDKAVEVLQKILGLDPNALNPRALFARTLKQMGDLRKAEEHINTVLILEDKAPQAKNLIERGDIRFRTGDKFKLVDALYDFEKAIEILESTREKTALKLAEYADEERRYKADPSNYWTKDDKKGNKHADKMRKAYQDEDEGDDLDDEEGEGEGIEEGDRDGEGKEEEKEGKEEEGEGRERDEKKNSNKNGDDFEGFNSEGEAIRSRKQSQFTATGNRRSSTAPSQLRQNVHAHFGRPDQNTLQTVEKDLGDVYFRRSQCKQMLAEGDSALIEQALEDARRATSLCPKDNDFHLAVATCHIRLGRFQQALASFQVVLSREPENEKALYQHAFCQRAVGQKKDAIEDLTKIIARSQQAHHNAINGVVDPSYQMHVPLDRVYGTRGTLFHEIQAHKLALHDLGRAVSLNADHPENFFLRGDCQAKLGHYEMALSDFNLAEDKGFTDRITLFAARGQVYRLLGDSNSARLDYEKALRLLNTGLFYLDDDIPENFLPANTMGTAYSNKQDATVMQLKLSSMRALCFVDLEMFNAARGVLNDVLDLIFEIEQAVLNGDTLVEAIEGIEQRLKDEEAQAKEGQEAPEGKKEADKAGDKDDKFKLEADTAPKVQVEEDQIQSKVPFADSTSLEGPEVPPRHVKKEDRGPREINTEVLVWLRKQKWVLLYHTALCWHNQKKYYQASEVLVQCTHETMLACAVDDMVLGLVYFFLGMQYSQLGRLKEAEERFEESLHSKWGQKDKNSVLLNFSKAKLFQQQERHEEAVEGFTKAIETDPENAWAFFRRAWSNKALGRYLNAGSDFETAKSLRYDDPNFSIDYKRITKFAYIEIESEPDLKCKFPALLPKPGSVM